MIADGVILGATLHVLEVKGDSETRRRLHSEGKRGKRGEIARVNAHAQGRCGAGSEPWSTQAVGHISRCRG